MKSISPLIAAVILISFTIAVSAITLPFIIKISKESTSQQEPAVKQVISCIGPDFKVYWNKVCQLKNGLVVWYTFDEGYGNITYDYSGNNNNGTLYNGSVVCGSPPNASNCPTWIDGKVGKALSFDGVNDYVNVPDSASLHVTSITIAVWVKLNSLNHQYIVGKTDGSCTEPGYGISLDPNGKFELVLWGGSNPTGIRAAPGGTLATMGVWYYVVGVADGSNMYLYLNGNLDRSAPGTLGSPVGTNPLTIGKTGCGYLSNGTIDEVRIYNRALSDEEIKQLYYDGLNNKFNISFTMLYTGVQAENIGKDFTANIILSNGTSITKTFSLTNPLGVLNPLEKVNLTIDGYYPSYGLIDKVIVCSMACPGICKELPPAQC